MSNGYLVKPVEKALRVLRCLAEERKPMTLTEICHHVRMPKTTVFRYLYTLCDAGFVEHDGETELYRLGLEAVSLGQRGSTQIQIRRLAVPYMQELREKFNETVNLGVLDGIHIVYIDMVESHHSLRMQARLGSRDPAYSTALGKAILAFLPETSLKQHLPAELSPQTARTMTSYDELTQNLMQVRHQGYALDREENEEGALCMGVPIFDGQGRVQTAISVSGPVSRLSTDVTERLARALVATSREISKRLGFYPPERSQT